MLFSPRSNVAEKPARIGSFAEGGPLKLASNTPHLSIVEAAEAAMALWLVVKTAQVNPISRKRLRDFIVSS